ncbi:MAG: hypothetical protein A3F67_00340 [Verrucomicrobia bacterium RIFCSPHIGHO2_12_FULL_41_10]|nr:MAG: hypothetical protein A3F67_00340 [Verrucomicrobia bacterium RIFCSPHIGHO2_12_FULL_41_10]HLB33482.1 hypothetical protein [Chthoniobacterales bacterium]
MKKLIPSILLAASASSSLLLAQNGTRLELPLQRQEMEDRRLKMEVEAQGCRLQKVEDGGMNEDEYNNQASLLEKDSIPICHLLSSISYLGIMPKLMMDPAELKNIEEGVEGLEEELVIFGKRTTQPRALVRTTAVTRTPVESSSSSTTVIAQTPSQLNHTTGERLCATILGKRDRDSLQVLLSTREEDRELRDIMRLERDEEKKKEDDSCGWVGRLLQRKVLCETKANKAQEAGKFILAAGCREAEGILEDAAEQCRQAALACAEGRESDGPNLKRIQECSTRQVCYLIKSAEKKENTKPEKSLIKKESRIHSDFAYADEVQGVDGSQNLSVQSGSNSASLSVCCEKWLAETGLSAEPGKLLSDYVMDVVKRGADNKLVSAFEEYRDHVIEAYELGDDSLALAWVQVAEDIQQAIEDSIKAVESGENKSYRLWNAWNNTAQATQKLAECRSQYIRTFSKLATADEVQGVDGAEKLSVQKLLDTSSTGATKQFAAEVEFGKRSIQASISSQTPEITNGWKKIVEESQAVADSYKKIIEVFESEKSLYCENFPNEDLLGERDRIGKNYIEQAYRIEYKYVEKTADSMKENLRKLIEAMTLFEKSFSGFTQSESLILWEKAVGQYQTSLELDVKALEEKLREDRKELALFRGVFYKETLPYKDKVPKFSK